MTKRKLKGKYFLIFTICSSLLTLIIFYTSLKGSFNALIQRSMFLMFIIPLIFFLHPATKKSKSDAFSFWDIILAISAAISFAWIIYSYPRLVTRYKYVSAITTLDLIFGTIAVITVIEAVRRTLGWILVSITLVFIGYVFIGPYIPGILGFKEIPFKKFIEHIYLLPEGLFNIMTGVSSTYLYTFIAFGTFLQVSGIDKYYMDICLALSGKARGGPAKVAIISSALMGTLSGSTISNVAITGNLTIPMMKNTGFSPRDAAAIETAASTGGAITPPIMGAGVFVMAAITGIPLVKIITYSIIPAIMYFISIYFFVELVAIKRNLKGLPSEKIPDFKKALVNSIHLFIPLIVLIYFLVIGYTPFWASSICTIFLVLLSYVRTNTRIGFSKFVRGLRESCENMMTISAVAGCAAIIMGVITITGISMKITSILISLSQGHVLLLLFLLTILAYILGMGMPVTLSYILVAMLGASALVKMGVPLLKSHLFLFWVSQVATISPPVCMTAFVAAEIAKERDYMKVGFSTLNVAKAIYLVPLIIIYTNIIHDNLLYPFLVLIRYLPLILVINIITANFFIRKLKIFDGLLITFSMIILFFAMFSRNIIMNWLFALVGSILIIWVYFIQKKSLVQATKAI